MITPYAKIAWKQFYKSQAVKARIRKEVEKRRLSKLNTRVSNPS